MAVKKKAAAKAKTTKHYDSEDSKQRLLKAAFELFSKEGYDAVGIRAIAKLSKVNEALVQRYFNGKLGLFFAIIEEFRKKHHQIPLAAPAATLELELENYFDARLAHGKRVKQFFKLVMSRAIVDPEVRAELATYSGTKSPGLVERLKLLRDQGKIRKDLDVEATANFLDSIVIGWTVFLHVMESMPESRVTELKQTAIKVLAQGLKS